MSAFRVIEPFQTFFDLAGNLAAGGTIEFYAAGTTTPKDVYGDMGLTVNNGSVESIGTDGRPVNDIWGDGSYRVRVYAADSTLIQDRDNIQIPGGSGTAIPALVAGQFLTNDGSVLAWNAIRQMLDATGQSGKVLGSDGTDPVWVAPLAQPNTTASGNSVKLSDGTHAVLIQWGTDSAPASGSHTTGQNITFPTAYTSAPFVAVSRGGAMTSSGFNGVAGAQSPTATGFFANFDINVDNANSAFNITSAIPFSWIAVGPVAA